MGFPIPNIGFYLGGGSGVGAAEVIASVAAASVVASIAAAAVTATIEPKAFILTEAP